jgi:hypothetical protein
MNVRIFILLCAATLAVIAALIIADVLSQQPCAGIERQDGWLTSYDGGVRVATPRYVCEDRP